MSALGKLNFFKLIFLHFKVHLLEVRGVREVNQRLMQEKELLLQEKEELAGICCFLDDDREKAKKVAREWQMFGRYATGVLQKELALCHTKIKELEQRQVMLAQENKNLKEICLMLDQEQAGSRNSVDSQNSFPCPSGGLLTVNGIRDSGDGSSNGSTTSNCSPDHRQVNGSMPKEEVYSSGEFIYFFWLFQPILFAYLNSNNHYFFLFFDVMACIFDLLKRFKIL